MRSALALACSSERRKNHIEIRTAPKESPFSRKAHPMPTLAISRPATAGPIHPPALNEVEFNATALVRSSSPTISATKVCLTGASNAAAEPDRKANTYTCQSRTTPAIVRTPSMSASTPIVACVNIRSLRWFRRSAADPVQGRRRSCGANCRLITIPSADAS